MPIEYILGLHNFKRLEKAQVPMNGTFAIMEKTIIRTS